PHQTRHPNPRIVLVGADNRVLRASRSRTVEKESVSATSHEANLDELTVNHGEERAATIATRRAPFERRRREDLQIVVWKVRAGFEGSFGTAKRRTAGLHRESKMARHKGRASSSPSCAGRLALFAAPPGEGCPSSPGLETRHR